MVIASILTKHKNNGSNGNTLSVLCFLWKCSSISYLPFLISRLVYVISLNILTIAYTSQIISNVLLAKVELNYKCTLLNWSPNLKNTAQS